MPFTPFHFGPGLALKGILRKYFSFSLFVFTQVLIDLESGYYLLQNEWPVHRFLHTYLGASLALLIALSVGKPACEYALKLLNKTPHSDSQHYFNPVISWPAAILGAGIGAFSHVLLDSIMHSDLQPFAPLFESNSLLNVVTLNQLHLFCIYSGFFGIVILIVFNLLKER